MTAIDQLRRHQVLAAKTALPARDQLQVVAEERAVKVRLRRRPRIPEGTMPLSEKVRCR